MPIGLLSTTSKIFEKGILKRLNPILSEKQLIQDGQFGFRQQHATIQHVQVTKVIRQALEEKKYSSSAFLVITQAFEKLWHSGLLH
jgi:hypothetical protein